MNIKKIFNLCFAATILFATSCKSDNDVTDETVTTYNGIWIANEGNYNSPNAGLDITSYDLNSAQSGIYKSVNNENLGAVLQSIAFWGNNAFLVLNQSNKIVIADRNTLKKTTEVTANLASPRYIAFSGSQYFVTNNDFSSTYKLNIYKTDNSFVTSISFDRYAEKVVEAGGKIIVQTDGTGYDSSWNEISTGHTITIVKPSTNAIEKTVTLPDSGIIKDLISYQGYAYALSSTASDSYIYKINPTDGTYTVTVLSGISQVQKLRIDAGNFYFIDGLNKVYSQRLTSASAPSTLFTATGYIYGFDVIDDKIFVADASFTGNSKVHVYNASNGNLQKTFSSGVGTNGFYKN